MHRGGAGQERFAGFVRAPARGQGGETLELFALGLPCKLFRDDGLAGYLHDERQLQPACGDAGTTVDRYDVRLLLESLDQFETESSDSSDSDSEDETPRGYARRWKRYLSRLPGPEREAEEAAQRECFAELPLDQTHEHGRRGGARPLAHDPPGARHAHHVCPCRI